MFRVLIYILCLNTFIFALEETRYTICVCTTSSLQNANNCKNSIEKAQNTKAFVIKDEKVYRTYLGSFKEYSQAKTYLEKSSQFVKKQEPFIKKISYDSKSEKKDKIEKTTKLDKKITKEKKEETKESKFFLDDLKSLEEFKSMGSIIIDKYTPKITKVRKVDNLLSDYAYFDSLIIEVDSSNNTMKVGGKSDRGIKNIKTYKVSTAKKDIKKPLGTGNVTSIALNPIWYPTQDTIQSFKKRGIELPRVVLGGDKLNYMGSAKINLTHRVDGQETYRIHGTLDEKTIGSYESSGCIRMRNSEVIQLVSILNEFIDFKSMNDIKVILK